MLCTTFCIVYKREDYSSLVHALHMDLNIVMPLLKPDLKVHTLPGLLFWSQRAKINAITYRLHFKIKWEQPNRKKYKLNIKTCGLNVAFDPNLLPQPANSFEKLSIKYM